MIHGPHAVAATVAPLVDYHWGVAVELVAVAVVAAAVAVVVVVFLLGPVVAVLVPAELAERA